jgi:hypothetical protein
MSAWLVAPYEHGDPAPGPGRADRRRGAHDHATGAGEPDPGAPAGQPTAETIVRLAVTAVFAYLLAQLIPGASRPVLARWPSGTPCRALR